MNGLEQRSNCNALTTAQIVTQFGNHPFKLGKNDVDRLAVVRFSNARRGIAASCFDAQPDELPWRRHAIHHGQQGIQKQLAIARCGTIERALQGCQFVTGTRSTDLLQYSSANFAILGRDTETRFNRGGDAILKDPG